RPAPAAHPGITRRVTPKRRNPATQRLTEGRMPPLGSLIRHQQDADLRWIFYQDALVLRLVGQLRLFEAADEAIQLLPAGHHDGEGAEPRGVRRRGWRSFAQPDIGAHVVMVPARADKESAEIVAIERHVQAQHAVIES